MTDSHIASDNYDTMTIEELRESLRTKQAVLSDVLRRNQHLEAEARRHEDAIRSWDAKVENLKRSLQMRQTELNDALNERSSALKLATSLYEKLTYLNTAVDKRPSDIKKVMEFHFHALEQVARITSWPELSEQDFFQKIFDAAELRVFGKKGQKRPTDAKEFVERSLKKKGKVEVPPGPKPAPRAPGPRPVG